MRRAAFLLGFLLLASSAAAQFNTIWGQTTGGGAAASVTVTDDTSTNATMYPLWVTANTGNLPAKVSSTGLSWNPSLGQLNVGPNTYPVANVYGGGTLTSDIKPGLTSFQGTSAYPQSTVNTGSGYSAVTSGIGRRFITVVLNTGFSGNTITITANWSATTLTAGTSFALGSDDTPTQCGVTATNIATAINTTAQNSQSEYTSTFMTATAVGPVVYLTKTPKTAMLMLATNAAGTICTVTMGTDNTLYLGSGNGNVNINQQGEAGGSTIIYPDGRIETNAGITAGSALTGVRLQSDFTVGYYAIAVAATTTYDLFLSRRGAANWTIGHADEANPVAQTVDFEGARAGTDTDMAGALATIRGSLGTGAGTNPGIKIQTGYPLATGTAGHVASDRSLTSGKWTTLTESSATGIATLTYGASSVISAEFLVTVQANDATNFQVLTSRVRVSSVQKATGNTVSAVNVVGTDLTSASSGTLTCTPTVTEAAGAVTLLENCVSSLTQTTLQANWQANTNGPGLTVAQL
jgi:hypothetical protein